MIKLITNKGLKIKMEVNSPYELDRFRTFFTKEPETISWIENLIKSKDTFYDIGANVGVEFALATGQKVQAINVGEKADDPERFTNKRSENYWRLREWILKGGTLVKHPEWKQLLTIYYKRNLSGKIQIMSKEDMYKKHGWESPDVADALSLCFNKEKSDGSTTRAVEGPSNAELAELANIY